MSDYVNNDAQFAPFDLEEDLNLVDWSAEYESLMQEPWFDPMDYSDWDAYVASDQGAAGELPGNR